MREVLTEGLSHSKQTCHEVNDTIKWYQATERDFYSVPGPRNPVLLYLLFG